MKWTDMQLQAINIPVSDIIVSAAAGSGKTAVMAERIISRLTGENYIDIDKILVVTYTNAAASEIKERVMKKLIEKIRDGNNKDLERQLVLLGNSHFCTIHSFCLELIKKYFYILNIDPSVKTGDQTELNTLLNKAVDTVFTQYFETGDTDFCNLLTCYGNNREAVLTELIINIYNFSRTMPDSIIWLDSLASKYSKDNKEALSYIMESTVLSLQYAITECEKAIEIILKQA